MMKYQILIIIQMRYGIIRGRVFIGELYAQIFRKLIYHKDLKVDLSVFIYRLFHKDFCSTVRIYNKQSANKCKLINSYSASHDN